MALPELPSQRVVISSFTLESGVTLHEAPIAFTSYGRLSKTRDNVIVVCHGFSANLQVHKWWSDLLGPGKALDTSRYFVICLNSLGSPFGSASPLTSIDGDRGKGPYGPNFPLTTIRDDVR
jgi:homoserine O-acetyltransferase